MIFEISDTYTRAHVHMCLCVCLCWPHWEGYYKEPIGAKDHTLAHPVWLDLRGYSPFPSKQTAGLLDRTNVGGEGRGREPGDVSGGESVGSFAAERGKRVIALPKEQKRFYRWKKQRGVSSLWLTNSDKNSFNKHTILQWTNDNNLTSNVHFLAFLRLQPHLTVILSKLNLINAIETNQELKAHERLNRGHKGCKVFLFSSEATTFQKIGGHNG